MFSWIVESKGGSPAAGRRDDRPLEPLKVDLGKGSFERGLSNMCEAIVVGKERTLQTFNRKAIVTATVLVVFDARF